MKLYKTTYETALDNATQHFKRHTEWHGSADDASKARTAAKNTNMLVNKPTTIVVEVLTNKVPLLEWLNRQGLL